MKKMKFFVIVPVSLALVLFVMSCGSDKNTNEACLHQTAMDLDQGNYDAVLNSSCADAMQLGAAWFGKAGFDIRNVINGFVDANSSTAPKSDLNIYMTALTGTVTDNTITYLDNAGTEYGNVAAGSEGYQDSQFYISLVDAMKGLSVIKSVIPGAVNPDGTLNTTCDQNNDSVPDAADATICELRLIAGQTCSPEIISTDTGTIQTLTLLNSAGTGTLTGQYRGIISQVTGTGPTATCPAPNSYKRLLFKQGSSWAAATLSDGVCVEAPGSAVPGREWPCPIESAGTPVDLVATIDTTLNSSITALSTALTGTNSTDVQQAIQDIKAQACGSGTCTSQSLADYLQTYLK